MDNITYSGREIRGTITYILDDKFIGLAKEYVIFSLDIYGLSVKDVREIDEIIEQLKGEMRMDEVIKLKDLTSMHCVGYMGYDDEWHPDSRYRKHFKIDQHHYTVNIWREEKNNWKLSVYLGLTNHDARDILLIRQSAKTMKELKKLAVDEINNYHNTERCTKDIEDWKKSHGKMVFDKDFNYLGITYTSPEAEKRNTEYDYYNNEKPKVGYGTYYMLCENSVAVCKIGCGWSQMGWDTSKELRDKLLQNMPDREV